VNHDKTAEHNHRQTFYRLKASLFQLIFQAKYPGKILITLTSGSITVDGALGWWSS